MSKFIRWDILAMLAGAGVLGFMLLVEPILGIADSGDFYRIMTSAGLSYIDPSEPFQERYFAFVHRQFAMVAPATGGYVSSELLVIFLSILIGKICNWQLFDIRFLGALYSLLLLAAFACLLQLNLLASKTAKYSFTIVFFIIFLDVGYTAYFNSLFGEPAAFIFLLLTIAVGLRLTEIEQPRIGWLVFFILFAVFATSSKIQNAPIGVILALLALRFLSLSNRFAWRSVGVALTSLLIMTSIFIYITAPTELRTINQYQTVFYGILKDSPTPESDLRALGLDSKLSILAGTNYFMTDTAIPQESDELKQSFYPHISHGKIIYFYLSHPSRYWEKLKVTAKHAMTLQIDYLGNHEKIAGFGAGAISGSFNLWSQWKQEVLPHSIWFLIAFWTLYYTVLLMIYLREPCRRKRATNGVFMAIGAIGAVAFLVPLIGDGEADMEKHLFLFNFCFDAMLTITLVWSIQRSINFFRERAS